MSHRRIWFHLSLLFALIAAGAVVYWWFHGPTAVPHLIASLKHEDWRNRQQTIATLGKIGPAAKPAVPHLLALTAEAAPLTDQIAAAAALTLIDPSAARAIVPTYVRALNSREARVRYEAGMVLAELGAIAKPAVPALVQATRDVDRMVRRYAVNALGRIGIPASQVLPALIAALEDKESAVRHDALLGLSYGGFAPDSLRQAEPMLRRLRETDNSAFIADSVLMRLERAGAQENAAALYLLASSRDHKIYALHKIAKIGPTAAEATAAVVRALEDEHPLVRYLAVEALGAIGPAAKESIPALEAALQDDDELVRSAAVEALSAIRGQRPSPPVTHDAKERG